MEEVLDIILLLDMRIDEDNSLKRPKGLLTVKRRSCNTCKMVELVLVRWKHSSGLNLTWEIEDEMKSCYPHMFSDA